ncbi:hypothetical protein [Selenomonas ruminantium]|uniref:hypothetical protein n=1 Tax=Selenomonas ruminantium TaxID=971 RepID=UPI0026EFEC23|nr:hypothetical protein [Selenomonas ruminantium]
MEDKDNINVIDNRNMNYSAEELPSYDELKNDVKNIKLEYLNEEYDFSAFTSDTRHTMSCILKENSNTKKDKK